jgi:hypothetical protein
MLTGAPRTDLILLLKRIEAAFTGGKPRSIGRRFPCAMERLRSGVTRHPEGNLWVAAVSGDIVHWAMRARFGGLCGRARK